MGVNQSARSKHHIGDDEEVNFDHFQILRAIGRGSFGKVCIVQMKSTGKMYAMKYMNKVVSLERDALRNVLREIDILTQLDHQFLVNLWFSFHDEEDMFLVQDLLLGGDLRYHLTQNVQFSLESVKLYIAEIAHALDYLQSKRVIHRDIKPDNILLDEDGHSHLTDFNVAVMIEEGKLATSLSGTKPYMAPEIYGCQANLNSGYSFAVDWWSLGVVAYEISTGQRPFEIHSQCSNKEISILLQKKPKWPTNWTEELYTIVSKLLCSNPLERLQTLDGLKALMLDMNWEDVMEKKAAVPFAPPKGHLNCDPTFELEEMIVESKPLHKKKKRLAKQRSLREFGSPTVDQEFNLDPLAEEFTTFNRQKELERLERERKEQEWEEELLSAMAASSPSPSTTPSTKEFRNSDSKIPACSSESPKSSSPVHPLKKAAWATSRSSTLPEGANFKKWKQPKSASPEASKPP